MLKLLYRVAIRDVFSGIASVILLIFFLLALVGEIYSIYCKVKNIEPIYERSDISRAYLAPSRHHILGTDFNGRDVFWRALFASRTAIKIGILAGFLSALIGVILGIVSGYFGGIVDEIVVWFYSSFASMPTLLFILAFSLLVTKGFLIEPLARVFDYTALLLNTDRGMLAIYLGVGLTGWVGLCRILRSETMRLKNEGYIQAAKSLGFGNIRIMFRHILPNLLHLVIVYFTVRFSYAVLTEVMVSYLGLGVQSEPSWGVMIADGQMRLWRGVWWEITAATVFMFMLVLSLNVFGDALRDELDPKLKM